jgi:O-antigen/teichoic acid export membrane protein
MFTLSIKFIRKVWQHFMHDSLYRNSIFIMLSTIVSSGVGFIFWKINTGLFPPSQIGIATTIIAGCQLLTNLSLLGINQSIIRFLPQSKMKSRLISSSIITVGIAAVLAATTYVLILPLISPALAFIHYNAGVALAFIILTTISGINIFTDSIFIALKKAGYILTESIFMGISRLILPFILIWMGAFGIFTAFIGSMIASLIVTIVGLAKNGVNFDLIYDKVEMQTIWKFSSSNYIAALFGSSIPLLLPTLITNILTPADAAFYYIALMISNVIAIIPLSTSNALYAELTHDITNLYHLLLKSLQAIFSMMLPIIISLIIFAKPILSLFGKEYSESAVSLLIMLVLSTIPLAIRNITCCCLRVFGAMKEFIIIEVITAVSIIGLSVVLMKEMGIVGIGFAWLITYTFTAGLFTYFTIKKYKFAIKTNS